MANRDITSSSGKGSALTGAEHDQNLNGLHGTVDEKTDDYTALYTDQGKTIQMNGASKTLTMDAIATIAAAIDTDSWLMRVKNIHASALTLARTGADTFDGATSLTLNQYDSVVLQINAAGDSWNIMAKDMDVVDINGGTIDGVTMGAGNSSSATHNLTNNTLDNAKTVQFNSEVDNGNSGASKTITWDNAQKQKVTVSEATTITLGNPTSVGNFVLKLVNGTAFAVTWAATSGSVLWAGGVEPTWTASGTDLIGIYYDGTNFYCTGMLDFS